MSDPLRLGGMALRNGLLVHGPTSWAAAVRAPDGTVHAASGRKPELPAASCGCRSSGASRAWARCSRCCRSCGEGCPRRACRSRTRVSRRPSSATSLATGGLRRSKLSAGRTESLAAFVGLVPPLVALRSSRELAGYHGAEHKAIGAYEHGGHAVDVAKEHERCGTHLVGPLVAATATANLLAARLPERARKAGRLGGSLRRDGRRRRGVRVGRPATAARASRTSSPGPGFAFQRAVATEEPSAEQLEVADRALDELLKAEALAAA